MGGCRRDCYLWPSRTNTYGMIRPGTLFEEDVKVEAESAVCGIWYLRARLESLMVISLVSRETGKHKIRPENNEWNMAVACCDFLRTICSLVWTLPFYFFFDRLDYTISRVASLTKSRKYLLNAYLLGQVSSTYPMDNTRWIKQNYTNQAFFNPVYVSIVIHTLCSTVQYLEYHERRGDSNSEKFDCPTYPVSYNKLCLNDNDKWLGDLETKTNKSNEYQTADLFGRLILIPHLI